MLIIVYHLLPKDVDGNIILPDAERIINLKATPRLSNFDGYCGTAYMTDINRMMSGLYALLLACKSTEYMIEEKVLYKFSLCLNVPERLFDCGAEESYKFLVYDESIA